MRNLVPCPNQGKCGSPRHYKGSGAWRKCFWDTRAPRQTKTTIGVPVPPVAPPTGEGETTIEQETFFAKSKAVDSQGSLIKVYSGHETTFDEFDPSKTGRGLDSWGSGFYFSEDESTAKGYGPEVREFYLDLHNPIRVDGGKYMSINHLKVSQREARLILLRHPNIKIQLGDDDNYNPLGDYFADFWDLDSIDAGYINRKSREMTERYFTGEGNLTNLEVLFGPDYATEFREAVRDVTGHDGVIVDFPEDGSHYVAWFPEQIKLTSNTNPQSGVSVSDELER